MTLSSDNLQQVLQTSPVYSHIKTWYLAYSGGVDSRVLLHLLAPLGLNLRVVYIDHGLQPESARWAEHCADVCQKYPLPFQAIRVELDNNHSQGLEAAARSARYQALADLMGEQDALLTAQHRDDQAETLLLQLFRGAGARGMASMAFCKPFANAWQLRPLLDYSRQQILSFAEQHQLRWIEDPSNQDQRFDRNFLRHQIMPRLRDRWPQLTKTLLQASRQQAENDLLLTELAEQDMLVCGTGVDHILSLEKLSELSDSRRRNLLRYWIQRSAYEMPSRKIMQQIVQQIFSPREDANLLIQWGRAEIRRYQQKLFLLPQIKHDTEQCFDWRPTEILNLPSVNMVLQSEELNGQGIRRELLAETLQVRFRQGGETIHLAGQSHRRSVKKLFQELEIPPWERQRIPFIFYKDELLAVGDYFISQAFASDDRPWGPVICCL